MRLAIYKCETNHRERNTTPTVMNNFDKNKKEIKEVYDVPKNNERKF